MDVEFDDEDLDRLETDREYFGGHGGHGGHGVPVVRAFRRTMQFIRAARDERDLYAMKSRRFEKLKGKRQHQHSLRLNDQWRLIVEIRGEHPQKRIAVIEINDYH